MNTGRPSSAVLGLLPETEIFVDKANFEKCTELPGLKVFQYNCAIFFMNRDNFKNCIFKKTLNLTSEELLKACEEKTFQNHHKIHTVIIDCSSISYLDTAGVDTVGEVVAAFNELNISCYLVACPTHVLSILESTKMLAKLNGDSSGIFPSIHDAVVHCSSDGREHFNFSEKVFAF